MPESEKQGSVGVVVFIVIVAMAGVGLTVYIYGTSVRGRRAAASPARVAAPQTGMASLTALSGQLGGQTFRLCAQFTIGRGAACNLRLPDPHISRLHTIIRFAQSAWFIQASGRTGLMVNGRRVMVARLNHGDQIQIGSTTWVFQER